MSLTLDVVQRSIFLWILDWALICKRCCFCRCSEADWKPLQQQHVSSDERKPKTTLVFTRLQLQINRLLLETAESAFSLNAEACWKILKTIAFSFEPLCDETLHIWLNMAGLHIVLFDYLTVWCVDSFIINIYGSFYFPNNFHSLRHCHFYWIAMNITFFLKLRTTFEM